MTGEDAEAVSGFQVHLDVFQGPFDLLLSLIAKHQLDVTLVALSRVTDEFIAHIRGLGEDWELGQASEFLVVAATLLDLKAARLLPAGEVTDDDDVAALEARDLLFARLLQYRAVKVLAARFAELIAAAPRRHPRAVSLEPALSALLPEVLLGVSPAQFAEIAAGAFRPRPQPTVGTDHVHLPLVSVREQAAIISARLREVGAASFRTLVADCPSVREVVGRFLAILDLYREGAVSFEQVTPLGDLHVRLVADAPATPEAGGEPELAGSTAGGTAQ